MFLMLKNTPAKRKIPWDNHKRSAAAVVLAAAAATVVILDFMMREAQVETKNPFG